MHVLMWWALVICRASEIVIFLRFQAVVWFYMHNVRPRHTVPSSLPQEQGCCTVSKTCSQNIHTPFPLLLQVWLILVPFLLPDLLISGPVWHSWTAAPLVMVLRLVSSHMQSTWAPHMASALADSIWKPYIYIFLQSQFDLMFFWVHFCHETTQPVLNWGWPAEQSARQGVISGSL